MTINKRLLVSAVNAKFELPALLDRFCGIRRESDTYTCKCPFHGDSRRSAKVYQDNRMYCFACAKQYGAYDVLTLIAGYKDEDLLKYVDADSVLLEDSRIHTIQDDEFLSHRAQFAAGLIDLQTLSEYVHTRILQAKQT
jgi:DNA primase